MDSSLRARRVTTRLPERFVIQGCLAYRVVLHLVSRPRIKIRTYVAHGNNAHRATASSEIHTEHPQTISPPMQAHTPHQQHENFEPLQEKKLKSRYGNAKKERPISRE